MTIVPWPGVMPTIATRAAGRSHLQHLLGPRTLSEAEASA
jgi:hypothetical protein